MKILPYEQGTPSWLAARAQHHCASDAPAMMGVSKYKSRSALLREKKTGITEDIDANKQALFDAGHATEALARKIIEERLGPLTPIVATDDEGWLLASFDGLNEARNVGWEHKLWNEGLADAVYAKDLPPMYYWQLEHQILVGGLKGVVFTVSDGTPDKLVSMKYLPVPGRAEQLIAGWKQFEADLATYVPPEVLPPVVAAPTLALPAVSIQVSGAVALTSNLGLFLTELKRFIADIPEKPSTDTDFANCKAACKSLQEAQDALDAAEANALGQVQSFDEMKRAKALCFDLARNTRLALEKLVVAREKAIKEELVMAGRNAFAAHIQALNKRLEKPFMPVVPFDFATAIKSKRTIASLQEAVNNELARAKIAASAIADGIQENLTIMRQPAVAAYDFLFRDEAQLVLKDADAVTAIVKSRISDHKAAEAKREEETRERIRKEEADKLAREHQKKLDDETAAQRKREADAAQKAATAQVDTSARVASSAQVAPDTGERGNSTATVAAPLSAAQPATLVPDTHQAPPAVAAVPYHVAHADGVSKLRYLISDELSEMSPGQLQEVLDFVREIRAARRVSA